MLRPNHPHARPRAGRSGPTPARRRRGHAALAVGALLGSMVVWGAGAPPASASADVTVGCNGAGNTATAADLQALRDAIVTQNNTAGADTITLTANCTYSFTAAYSGAYASWFGPAALPAIASYITI